MSITTDIQWCDSTLNLQMGCDGCELWNPKAGVRKCYAGQLTERRSPTKGWPDKFGLPRIFPERIAQTPKWKDLTDTDRPDKPWLNGLPRLVFLNDMGDTFTKSLPIDWLEEFIPALENTPHIYIVLTKRADRMRTFFRSRPVPGVVSPNQRN
jgi:protein gp37